MADTCKKQKAGKDSSFSYYAKGHPVITMYGNEKLVIENYRKLLTFSPERITLSTAMGKLCIRGKRLLISCFCSGETEIRGYILSVGFGQEDAG